MRINGLFKYGRSCYLTIPESNWCSEVYKAYLQPIRYKTKIYLEGDFTEIGHNSNDVYLYLGPASHDLTRNPEEFRIVDSDGNYYKADKAEKIFMGDKCIYIWAVIRKTTEVFDDGRG